MPDNLALCVTLGFGRSGNEICALLGFDTE